MVKEKQTMKQLSLLFTLLLHRWLSPASEPRFFHVSSHGDDAGSGTAEKPFRTFERARDAVRPLQHLLEPRA